MSSPMLSGLSGNEIFCMNLKGFSPCGIVVGNSVQSMGFLGGVGSAFKGVVGGEIGAITSMIHQGREAAYERMAAEAKSHGAVGVVGVSSELRSLAGNSEFLFMGSGVVGRAFTGPAFTSAGDAQELYCHIDAGYQPLQFVFGNIAYSIGLGGGVLGGLKTLVRGEIKEFSDIFNATRHHALGRMVAQAVKAKANSVVGIRTNVMRFNGFHEMYMYGTAAHHPSLPSLGSTAPVTSDLTGEELWAMTSLGYAPVKLLMSTSVYSLGFAGGVKALFKGFVKGEISDLTTMVYDAREQVFDRIKSEAAAAGADEVVGLKSYIVELGSGLIEFVAIGTAVRKMPNFKVDTPTLPVQAIIRDKDTWVSGESAFDLQSTRAGG